MDDYNYDTWSELVVTETISTATTGHLTLKLLTNIREISYFLWNIEKDKLIVSVKCLHNKYTFEITNIKKVFWENVFFYH